MKLPWKFEEKKIGTKEKIIRLPWGTEIEIFGELEKRYCLKTIDPEITKFFMFKLPRSIVIPPRAHIRRSYYFIPDLTLKTGGREIITIPGSLKYSLYGIPSEGILVRRILLLEEKPEFGARISLEIRNESNDSVEVKRIVIPAEEIEKSPEELTVLEILLRIKGKRHGEVEIIKGKGKKFEMLWGF